MSEENKMSEVVDEIKNASEEELKKPNEYLWFWTIIRVDLWPNLIKFIYLDIS